MPNATGKLTEGYRQEKAFSKKTNIRRENCVRVLRNGWKQHW